MSSRRERVYKREESNCDVAEKPHRTPVPLYYDTDVSDRARTHPKVLHRWMTRVESRFFGTPIDIHPYDGLLKCIAITHGEVTYCDKQISRLSEDELFERPLTTTIESAPEGGIVTVTQKRDMETVSRWVTFRQNAVDKLARYCKMAIDVGIEERQITLAESQANIIRIFFEACMRDIDLTPEQRSQVSPVMHRNIALIEEITNG